MLARHLERSGFVVERASNGDDALTRSGRFQPHVVLLNWSLPTLNGIEVCRRLRALLETRDVGVIMTGRTGDRRVVRALDAGADDYLVNPFSIAELLARMRALLRRTRAESEKVCLSLGDLVWTWRRCASRETAAISTSARPIFACLGC
jgi:two-component system phosphate regulon response regulator PhoB